jgi:hypothetical protein
MGSLVDELRRRETAARAEAEQLRGQIAELAERLAGVEGRLSRLVIAREVVDEVLGRAAWEVSPVPGQPRVGASPGAGPAPVPGVLAVPLWRAGLDASVLPRDYRDLLEVAGDAGRPLRAGQIAGLAAVEAVRGSFEAAHAAITRRCGPVMGKRQAGQAVVSAACDIAAFYAVRIPVPCTASTLLVISAGAKGIVMRPQALRPKTARAAARHGRMRTRLTPGEKPCRTRMATLACVYDTEPAPRRPHDIIAPPGGRHGHRTLPPRPKATAKWLAGSVRHDPAEVIAAAFAQAEARDPRHQRTWVVLADGAEHQLDLIRAEAARRGVTIHIVTGLIHVLEYIGKPHGPGTRPATPQPRTGSRSRHSRSWPETAPGPPPRSPAKRTPPT